MTMMIIISRFPMFGDETWEKTPQHAVLSLEHHPGDYDHDHEHDADGGADTGADADADDNDNATAFRSN